MTTPGGLLLPLAVLAPFAGMLAGLALGGRNVRRVAWLMLPVGLGIAIAITFHLLQSGAPVVYHLGGWAPPLGVALRADGLAVVMLLAVAVVIGGIGIYAGADFDTPQGVAEARSPFSFWLLLLAVWGALNLVLVGGDLFTLYVALELLTFAAVPLVCLDGRGETVRAATRYLLFALIGSILYLLGAVLIYGGYGTLDIALLAEQVDPGPVAWAATALMTVGLLAKTALFPLHLWLPPAHAGAPAAGSAILSALVVKGSWFLVVRIWLDVMPGVVALPPAQILGALGVAAILVGNIVALRQGRLKMLIAYSTVAQIGYLFLMFPLAAGLQELGLPDHAAVAGGLLQAVSHALAKASLFLAAGLVYVTLGHDRIADLRGIGRSLPMTVVAMALAGASLIGLPPTGGFLAKWLLLEAALASGQWWWALAIVAGGLLTGAYVFTVIVRAMAEPDADWRPQGAVAPSRQAVVLALSVGSLLLGLAALLPPAAGGAAF